MIRARGLVTTIALACLLAPLAISTETVAAGTTSTGSDDGSQTGHRDDPGHRTPPAQKAPLQPCRSGHARCGTVRRLLDPTRPNGARIGIGFELYPTGTIRWYRHSGLIRAHVHVTGPGAQPSDLTLRWNDLDRHPRALAQGVAGGQRVRFVFPAP